VGAIVGVVGTEKQLNFAKSFLQHSQKQEFQIKCPGGQRNQLLELLLFRYVLEMDGLRI
jgi:hypothetical protein